MKRANARRTSHANGHRHTNFDLSVIRGSRCSSTSPARHLHTSSATGPSPEQQPGKNRAIVKLNTKKLLERALIDHSSGEGSKLCSEKNRAAGYLPAFSPTQTRFLQRKQRTAAPSSDSHTSPHTSVSRRLNFECEYAADDDDDLSADDLSNPTSFNDSPRRLTTVREHSFDLTAEQCDDDSDGDENCQHMELAGESQSFSQRGGILFSRSPPSSWLSPHRRSMTNNMTAIAHSDDGTRVSGHFKLVDRDDSGLFNRRDMMELTHVDERLEHVPSALRTELFKHSDEDQLPREHPLFHFKKQSQEVDLHEMEDQIFRHSSQSSLQPQQPSLSRLSHVTTNTNEEHLFGSSTFDIRDELFHENNRSSFLSDSSFLDDSTIGSLSHDFWGQADSSRAPTAINREMTDTAVSGTNRNCGDNGERFVSRGSKETVALMNKSANRDACYHFNLRSLTDNEKHLSS